MNRHIISDKPSLLSFEKAKEKQATHKPKQFATHLLLPQSTRDIAISSPDFYICSKIFGTKYSLPLKSNNFIR